MSSHKVINPAKRGDLFIFPVYHQVTYLHAPPESTVEYVLAQVTSITRDGIIKGYRVAGDCCETRGIPSESRLVPAAMIYRKDAIDAYIARHEWDRSFTTIENATEFLRPFLKKRLTLGLLTS